MLTHLDTVKASELLETEYGFPNKIILSNNAKRVTLRVAPVSSVLRITVPPLVTYNNLKKFIKKNIEWINSQLLKSRKKIVVSVGSEIPIHGVPRTLTLDFTMKEKYCLESRRLVLSESNLVFVSQVKTVLKQLAMTYFQSECNKYSKMLNVRFKKISIKDTKSRWGSCSNNGNIMFSWRLMLAPQGVSSYVAAHEMAHLVFFDHSSQFWQVVKRIDPDFEKNRNWLKKYGSTLHQFVF